MKAEPEWLPNSDKLDNRLARFEFQVAEKVEVIRSDLRETNRRLRNLEEQSAQTQSALDLVGVELSRLTQQLGQSGPAPIIQGHPKLDDKIDHLGKGIGVVLSALRMISSDISSVKNNISGIADATM